MTMEDPLLSRWQGVLALVSEPWFNIGSTPITPMRMVGLVVIITLVWWLASALERGIRRLMHEKGQGVAQQPGVYVLARMTRYTVWVVGLLVGFNYIGFDVATLALFGGAVGVGIGLGLQNIFANFISGIVLLLERTLKVGDFVDLQSGVVGTVTEIGMRYTRVTTNDNVDIVVPNSEFINGRVTNWTMSERRRRIHVPFSVAYGSDKENVREAAVAAAHAVKGTLNEPGRGPEAWLVRMADSGLEFELVVWVDNERMTTPARTHAAYLWALETELVRRGIEIPFPQRDLHIRSGTLQVRMDGTRTAAQDDA